MLSKYQDANTFWHHKPTVNGKPSSNNAYIYTAYAKALGLPYNKVAVRKYFDACVKKLSRDNITIYRHPGQKTPPFSFDEVMGAVYLDLMPYDALKGNHFVHIGHGERLDSRIFEKLLKAMIELTTPRIVVKGWRVTVKKPKLSDRNAWWERNMVNVKYFAARLTPDKTYIVKRYHKKKFHNEEEKIYAFHRDLVMKKRPRNTQDYSTRNLLWLMLIMNGDYKRARKMKIWESFEVYFGRGHDFVAAAKKMYGVR